MHALNKDSKSCHRSSYPYALQENEAVPQHESSFGPPVKGHGPPPLSLQVPDAPVQGEGEGEGATTMPPKSSADGLALKDVVVDMSGQSLRLC